MPVLNHLIVNSIPRMLGRILGRTHFTSSLHESPEKLGPKSFKDSVRSIVNRPTFLRIRKTMTFAMVSEHVADSRMHTRKNCFMSRGSTKDESRIDEESGRLDRLKSTDSFPLFPQTKSSEATEPSMVFYEPSSTAEPNSVTEKSFSTTQESSVTGGKVQSGVSWLDL